MNAMSQPMTVEKMMQGQQARSVHLKGKSGNLYGGNYTIPNGDFSRFLGWKPETDAEKSGEQQTDGWRTVQVAIQKEMDKVGKGAVQRGSSYRNIFIAPSAFKNQPGRERDYLTEGLNAVSNSLEQSQELNMRYLEMQYKFQLASKNYTCVTNLMKARHDSVKKSMDDVK